MKREFWPCATSGTCQVWRACQLHDVASGDDPRAAARDDTFYGSGSLDGKEAVLSLVVASGDATTVLRTPRPPQFQALGSRRARESAGL